MQGAAAAPSPPGRASAGQDAHRGSGTGLGTEGDTRPKPLRQITGRFRRVVRPRANPAPSGTDGLESGRRSHARSSAASECRGTSGEPPAHAFLATGSVQTASERDELPRSTSGPSVDPTPIETELRRLVPALTHEEAQSLAIASLTLLGTTPPQGQNRHKKGSELPWSLIHLENGAVVLLPHEEPIGRGKYKTVKKVLLVRRDESGRALVEAFAKSRIPFEMLTSKGMRRLDDIVAQEREAHAALGHLPHVSGVFAELMTQNQLGKEKFLQFQSLYSGDCFDIKNVVSCARRTGVPPVFEGVEIDRKRALELVHMACMGLSEIHAAGFIHRDIKPENVLVRPKEGRLEAVIADLGFARLESLDKQEGVSGTRGFFPPEVEQPIWTTQGLQYQRVSNLQTAAGDVYALGATIYEILNGRRIPSALRFNSPNLASDVSPEMKIVFRMLSHDPAARGTAAEAADGFRAILEHLNSSP